ncbi:MAG: hypothetical protein ABIK89_21120, partial [Planctomycetota bacterium]
MEAGLERLRASAPKGRLKDPELARERLGRLTERNWRAASAFDVRIRRIAGSNGQPRLAITWSAPGVAPAWRRDTLGAWRSRPTPSTS